jgi:hypothetical protein
MEAVAVPFDRDGVAIFADSCGDMADHCLTRGCFGPLLMRAARAVMATGDIFSFPLGILNEKAGGSFEAIKGRLSLCKFYRNS